MVRSMLSLHICRRPPVSLRDVVLGATRGDSEKNTPRARHCETHKRPETHPSPVGENRSDDRTTGRQTTTSPAQRNGRVASTPAFARPCPPLRDADVHDLTTLAVRRRAGRDQICHHHLDDEEEDKTSSTRDGRGSRHSEAERERRCEAGYRWRRTLDSLDDITR
jgi:hypothetical protein